MRPSAIVPNLARFVRDQSGASAVEYALIVTMIGVAVIVATRQAGLQISAVFNTITEALMR